MKNVSVSLLFCLLGYSCMAQNENKPAAVNIFEKITGSMSEFKIDTTTPPDDKATRKINELRAARGVFNINEAIEFKLEEDRREKKMSEDEWQRLATFFRSGIGKRYLDNAVNWIYRTHFTYAELKQLVKFYKTPAGQKSATAFPFIMLQTLTAAETIKNTYFK